MKELKVEPRVKNILDVFIRGLRDIYKDSLICVILYGSAASGEFIAKHSNLNLLVVLKNTDLITLRLATGLINKFRFRMIHPIFFTEDYMTNSTDVFPIEFQDIKDNYALLYGKDVCQDIHIDLKNLRFQCEHELKVKLINLKQRYFAINKNKSALLDLLLHSFTSIVHILRSALRLKGQQPAYLKEDVLKEIASEFKINLDTWRKILAAKKKTLKLKSRQIEELFIDFVGDLEKIVDTVDKF